MTTIHLTEEQMKQALTDYVNRKKYAGPKAYKEILDIVFGDLFTADWDWLEMLRYAVKLCSRRYAVDVHIIRGSLK